MVSCVRDPDSVPVKHPSVINLQTPIIYPSVVFFSIRIVPIKQCVFGQLYNFLDHMPDKFEIY